MSFDIFISYCWTNDSTKTFVHSLAAHLKLVGFNVGVDIDVDYGDKLSGFMEQIVSSRHVLMVLDEPYVERANTLPETGVGIENELLKQEYPNKPSNWLSVAFINQRKFPDWLKDANPKGFVFDLNGKFQYGAAAIDSLWRWIEGMPTSDVHAVNPAVIKERLYRVEKIDALRDPAHWSNPDPSGSVAHYFNQAPRNNYRIGFGDHEFQMMVTKKGGNSVYLCKDPIMGVGLLPPDVDWRCVSAAEAYKSIVPGRIVTLVERQSFVLMNKMGAICVGHADAIECFSDPYKEHESVVEFRYRILVDE